MGDFNYPNINWLQQTVEDNINAECKDFFNCCNDCFLTQHVSQGTRDNAILDLVFSSEPELVSNVKIIDNLGNSDHNMVTFSIQHEQKYLSTKRQIRDYNKGNYQSIREELQTSGSAMAEGPHDELVSRNSATTKYPYRMALFA